MAIQESDGEFHEELGQEEEFNNGGGEEERVPDTGKKHAPAGKGTPTWRLIEDYRDRKRLEDELEDLDDLDKLDLDEE
ncbi:MAG: DUF3545 family protein [Gammaproteobacteria bacterium]|nr:DUF3545 family protein [Gammaproteobacteria bacterium]